MGATASMPSPCGSVAAFNAAATCARQRATRRDDRGRLHVDGAVGRVGRSAGRARADDADERSPVGRVLRDSQPGHERNRDEASSHAREAAERPGCRADGGHRVRLRVWRLGGGQGAAREGGAASESAEQHVYESLFTATRCVARRL